MPGRHQPLGNLLALSAGGDPDGDLIAGLVRGRADDPHDGLSVHRAVGHVDPVDGQEDVTGTEPGGRRRSLTAAQSSKVEFGGLFKSYVDNKPSLDNSVYLSSLTRALELLDPLSQ